MGDSIGIFFENFNDESFGLEELFDEFLRQYLLEVFSILTWTTCHLILILTN